MLYCVHQFQNFQCENTVTELRNVHRQSAFGRFFVSCPSGFIYSISSTIRRKEGNMNTLTITKAFVSGGYDDKPVLYTSEDGNYCSFRIGEAVYDKEADDNTRWLNYEIKVSGADLCARVKKMNLKKGTVVSISGRFDIGTYEKDGVTRMKCIVWLKDIDFNGLKKKEDSNGENDPSAGSSGGEEKGSSSSKKDAQKETKSNNEGDTYYDPGNSGPSEEDVPYTPYANFF